MMMALAGMHDLPCVLVPGGVTLPPAEGEDAGKIQTIGVRFAHGKITLEEAAELGCRACASPGGGCQFLGTAATARWSAKRWDCRCRIRRWLHRASRSGSIWRVRSARALLSARGRAASPHARHSDVRCRCTMRWWCTPRSADRPICCSISRRSRTPPDCRGRPWTTGSRSIARCRGWWTRCRTGRSGIRRCSVFLAGGVPEVMLHLRSAGLAAMEMC